MAITVELDERAIADADSLVEAGLASSREDAVRRSLGVTRERMLGYEADPFEEACEDIDAGRTIDSDTVFKRLLRRYGRLGSAQAAE